jgi:hypothetical protein
MALRFDNSQEYSPGSSDYVASWRPEAPISNTLIYREFSRVL